MKNFLMTVLILLLSPACFPESNKIVIPDKAGDFQNGIYHVGLWVDDVEEMLAFLTDVSSLKVISRVQLSNGGERLFLSDTRGQRLELLSNSSIVKPHTQYPLHPRGAFAGMAHISIEVDDVVTVKDRLIEMGYEIISQVPKDYADGYVTSEVDAHRVLFIEGPSSMSFEFFEIQK